ncbi:MAG: transposase [Desulfatirhabdiaceae bacterium]
MPRTARLDAPGVLHHVMGRGIEKRIIFRDDEDRSDFLDRLSALAREGAMDIYAWVLMPNHFHLLCKTKNMSLASSMRKILTGYVINFNRRHHRNGHLFQNRYKSIVCQEDIYLKELVRYIHLNPLRAGLVQDINTLHHHPWAGHSALVGNVKREWQDTGYVLSFFGEPGDAVKIYVQFVTEGMGQGRKPDLVGGGLIRSMGGAAVLANRRRGQREAADQRILGDGDFVHAVISDLDDRMKRNLRPSGQRIDLETLAEKIGERYDVTVGELRSGSRRRAAVVARRMISWIGVREYGFRHHWNQGICGGPIPTLQEFVSFQIQQNAQTCHRSDRHVFAQTTEQLLPTFPLNC